ncbi:transposase family protein, partial [Klebsiella pneumoniae]|nr:transposase family protein [Klebsiella pneumoniae]
KYLHVSVDTCSGCIHATAEIKSNARAAIRHCCAAFATLGVPQQIKTDNGPCYKSSLYNNFLQNWGVEHRTGIPGNSGGQAIVERAHQTIKRQLDW